MKVLLVPIEFSTWNQARAWSYTGAYAFIDGLKANDINYTFAPLIVGQDGNVNTACLDFVRNKTAEHYDQVWVWCVHGTLPDSYWEWFSKVADLSVGVLMESLTFESYELTEFPHLKNRREIVLEQLKNFDKALVCSESDAVIVHEELGIEATWYPPMIPEEYVNFREPPTSDSAVFVGSNYGKRREYLNDSKLSELLTRPHLPERDTDLPFVFDNILSELPHAFKNHQEFESFRLDLIAIRKTLFELHLEGLRMGFANVNLPSILKGFAGRVVESMCASVPVVSWLPPGKEQGNLFEKNEDILFFSSINECIESLDLLKNNLEYRDRITTNARNKLLTRHTSRIRIRQLLIWIQNGKRINYNRSQAYCPSLEESLYYKELFVKNQSWNRLEPNSDELSRWQVINKFLAETHPIANERLNIAEIGCGRGWLSKLMCKYGEVTALDPIGDVIHYAKSNYQGINFITGSAELLEFLGLDNSYDVVVSSEVLEHITDSQKPNFIKSLVNICKPGGSIIVSTPRRDILEDWINEYGVPNQPTEEWIFEADLTELFIEANCTSLKLERAFLMDIYQIHLFKKKP
ncbi:methyltransferase domain-containing protein [Alteromonas hispanica]|uniref:Methyltransferase domain-containing protein n=1 Tax=Alteromonas hispanica TaxID=315421 RepID=A0A6L9MRX1_9ALTE|nr:methyltransferase domain-containing protein [Alteromonas hispanica]NDW20660.1 methyltransferase domain-containing protein [Alteromonas hispanica]